MANLKSSKKDILRNKRNRLRNQTLRSSLKTAVKVARVATVSKAEDRVLLVREALKRIDKTMGKGILHKNAAARKKSRLAKLLNTTL